MQSMGAFLILMNHEASNYSYIDIMIILENRLINSNHRV